MCNCVARHTFGTYHIHTCMHIHAHTHTLYTHPNKKQEPTAKTQHTELKSKNSQQKLTYSTQKHTHTHCTHTNTYMHIHEHTHTHAQVLPLLDGDPVSHTTTTTTSTGEITPPRLCPQISMKHARYACTCTHPVARTRTLTLLLQCLHIRVSIACPQHSHYTPIHLYSFDSTFIQLFGQHFLSFDRTFVHLYTTCLQHPHTIIHLYSFAYPICFTHYPALPVLHALVTHLTSTFKPAPYRCTTCI